MASTRRQVALARLRSRQADFSSVRAWRPGQVLLVTCPDCACTITIDPAGPSHSLSAGPLPSVSPGIMCTACGCGFAFINGMSSKLNGRTALPPAPAPPPPPEESPVTPVPGVAPSAESLSSGSSKPALEDLPWPDLLALAKKLGVSTRTDGVQRTRVDIEADLAGQY